VLRGFKKRKKHMIAEIIGYIAATLTTIALVPQIVKVIKTKDTKNLSLVMYIVFILGITGWLVFGIMIENLAMIISNSITIVFGLIILSFKIYNVSKGEKP